MDKKTIKDRDKKLFNKYLKKEDYKSISIETEKPESSVVRLSKQEAYITDDNILVYLSLKKHLCKRMVQSRQEINTNIKHYR